MKYDKMPKYKKNKEIPPKRTHKEEFGKPKIYPKDIDKKPIINGNKTENDILGINNANKNIFNYISINNNIISLNNNIFENIL